MKNSNFSLPRVVLATLLISGITTGICAKEAGVYVHGGVTYWNDLELPKFEDRGELGDTPVDYEIDGSRAQPSFGIGFNFNKQWGIEASYVATPERMISIEVISPSPLDMDEVLPVSWLATAQHTVVGINAVYDLYVNTNVSLFAKAGAAMTRHTSETRVSFGDETSLVEEEESTELVGAVGVRFPIGMKNTSISIAYQFLETSEDRETSFEVGLQWGF